MANRTSNDDPKTLNDPGRHERCKVSQLHSTSCFFEYVFCTSRSPFIISFRMNLNKELNKRRLWYSQFGSHKNIIKWTTIDSSFSSFFLPFWSRGNAEIPSIPNHGDLSDLNNHNPISLTVISGVFKAIIPDQLRSFFRTRMRLLFFSLFCRDYFGFSSSEITSSIPLPLASSLAFRLLVILTNSPSNSVLPLFFGSPFPLELRSCGTYIFYLFTHPLTISL